MDAIGEVGPAAPRDLDRQACLAGATGSRQIHQPVVGQQLPYIGDLRAATDETGELDRKILRLNARRCPQRREFVAQVGVAHLRYQLGPGQISQLVGAQIGQPRVCRQPVDDQLLGRTTAAFGRRDPDRAVAQSSTPCGAPALVASQPPLNSTSVEFYQLPKLISTMVE